MAINFGSHAVATASEKQIYQYMDSMNLTYRVSRTDQWESTINFEEGEPLDVFCTASYFPRETIFDCSYKSQSQAPDSKDNMPRRLPFSKSRISEIRYGDIDKDGDIDIAVKLTNGAIYVFHNLEVR